MPASPAVGRRAAGGGWGRLPRDLGSAAGDTPVPQSESQHRAGENGRTVLGMEHAHVKLGQEQTRVGPLTARPPGAPPLPGTGEEAPGESPLIFITAGGVGWGCSARPLDAFCFFSTF